MRLKPEGPWLGGLYGDGSYAAGYPEEPQDLYLEQTFAMDQNDGSFVRDADGRPVALGAALLVRWDEVLFMEFVSDGEEER